MILQMKLSLLSRSHDCDVQHVYNFKAIDLRWEWLHLSRQEPLLYIHPLYKSHTDISMNDHDHEWSIHIPFVLSQSARPFLADRDGHDDGNDQKPYSHPRPG